MEKFLIFIKHKFTFLWRIIERINGQVFRLIYASKLQRILPEVLSECKDTDFTYKQLGLIDLNELHELINRQENSDLLYFKPHGFDQVSIMRQFKNSSFLMMGAFHGNRMVGYFFLRLFANRKCFVGRLIDKEYRGKGIGLTMNKIMYETAWRINFRCLSTISRNNAAVIRAHARNQTMQVIKELKNGYLLVEFKKINKVLLP